MISTLFLTNLLLVSAALAGPLEASHKHDNRQADDRSLWAGAFHKLQTINTINSVSAVFTIPTLSGPGDGYIWVGLDTFSCQNYFRTGIHFTSNTDGMSSTYNSFYEWHPYTPLNPYDSDILFSPGDSVRISLSLSNPNSGTATVENLTKKTSTKTDIVGASYPLCQLDADWIVQSGSVLPHVRGPIVFTEAAIGSHLGKMVPALGLTSTVDIARQTTTMLDTGSVSITFTD